MEHQQLAPTAIYLVLLALVAPGCQALHSYRPVAVLTRDAETGKPIADAEVHISYPHSDPNSAPYDSVGPTGADGIAHLRAVPYGDFDIAMAGSAPGYLAEHKPIPVKEMEAIKPAHFFEDVDKRPVNYVLELYAAEPAPSVELIVPTGYRGEIEVEVHAREDLRCQPGQRCFRFEVPAKGVAQLTGPALLHHVWFADYKAKYADGTPLPPDSKDNAIGFWFLHFGGATQFFFVGTRQDYDLRCKTPAPGPTRQHSNNGGGGGQGRRGRRGSQSNVDPGS